MKRLLALLIICGLLILPVMAITVKEPNINETFNKKAVIYSEETTPATSIITTLSKLIGLNQDTINDPLTQPMINVEVDNQVIAIISPDSKFNGMDIHEYCLAYQYGTTRWYNCEQELVSV
jgi:hypothetical protein